MDTTSEIPADPAVANEFNLSYSRGTIAMALLSGDINSGTNQWFFNSIDNSGTLNPQSFTVFGRITSQAGLATLDKLQAVRAPNPAPLASPFDSIPLIDYTGGDVKTENLIIINSIRADRAASATGDPERKRSHSRQRLRWCGGGRARRVHRSLWRQSRRRGKPELGRFRFRQ